MIISIRGTSGSGKTTLVRQLMDCYGTIPVPTFEEGRKRPLSYLLARCDDQPIKTPLAIPGHYETPCGGCDTIQNYDKIFGLIRQYHAWGMDVVYEGLLLSAEYVHTAKLFEDGLDPQIVFIDHPIQGCLDSVNARRAAKSPDKGPVNPKNTIAKDKATRSTLERFRTLGLQVHEAGREDALALIRDKLCV